MATIYADNAATTQMSRAAIDAMLPYLETIYGNPSSLHSVGQQAAGALLSEYPPGTPPTGPGRCSARATASQNA